MPTQNSFVQKQNSPCLPSSAILTRSQVQLSGGVSTTDTLQSVRQQSFELKMPMKKPC